MKKSSHIVVVSFNPGLIARLGGHVIVVRTEKPEELPAIERTVIDAGARLHCIALKYEGPLMEFPWCDEFQHIPLALFLSGLGPYRAVRKKTAKLSRSNTKVFFPAREENLRSIRILSSLGVGSGIVVNGALSCWESLSDLMHYAAYGRLDHGPVEPFHHIIEHYEPGELGDFSPVYFDDMRRFIHCDESGALALTARECDSGIFIAECPEEIAGIAEKPAYRERIDAWRDSFIGYSRCACCEAWRICGGMFKDHDDAYPQCSELMSDLLDAAEFHHQEKKKRRELWQS
jgi:hypothetical protein